MGVSFNFVTERIAVGGEILSKADVDQIVGAGITHVIDMRAEFDDDTLNDDRSPILWLPQVDDGTDAACRTIPKRNSICVPGVVAGEHQSVSALLRWVKSRPYDVLRALAGIRTLAGRGHFKIRAARPEVVFYVVQNYRIMWKET